jgi:hypothetical protein
MDYNDLAGFWVAKEYGTGGAGVLLILALLFGPCSSHAPKTETDPHQTPALKTRHHASQPAR